jgi:hypothetical protein
MTTELHQTAPRDRSNLRHRPPGDSPGLLSLLFKLSMAAALPPAAIMAPASPAHPTIHRKHQTTVSVDALEGVIRRPISAPASGRVLLGEVDQRLNGLTIQLDTFRLTDEQGGLVSIGLVSADPESSYRDGATARTLWLLAHEALVTHGVPCEHLVGIGDDAFLALHGGCTAQVAWLTRDRLATVSVTTPRDDSQWAMSVARSIARFADEHLAPGDNARSLTLAGRSEHGR